MHPQEPKRVFDSGPLSFPLTDVNAKLNSGPCRALAPR